MDLKKVLNALNTALPVGTDIISKEEPVVHHIPTGRSFTVPEAAEMAAALASENMEVLSRVDSDTEQTILVNILGKKKIFSRTRENKDAEWQDWQKKAEI